MTNPIPGADAFNGDDAALCQSIDALLSIDAEGALVPHGLGGHARKLLSTASLRLAAKVGANVAADILTWRERQLIAEPETKEFLDCVNEALGRPHMLAEIADLRKALAAGAPAETPKPMNLVRACNAEYPIPDSPHASVITRNEANREAFGKGWLACTRANLAAQPAPAPSACADVEKDAWRWRFLRDSGVPSGDGHEDDALLVYKGFGESSLLPDQLDEAIDAAMLAASSPAEAR